MKSKTKPSEGRTPAEEERAARESCLRLLSRRARSAGELRERLRAAGYGADVIREVLAGLQAAGLVDDEEFARWWVAGRKAAGGAARRRLSWELKRKGVDRTIIERVLGEQMDDETELGQATELARKRLRGGRAEGEDLSRLRRHLLGRGFGYDTVDHVIRAVTREKET